MRRARFPPARLFDHTRTVTPFVIAAVLVALAVVVATLLQRRTDRGGPAQGTSWSVPAQLHRPDFVRPDVRWLVVVFSSETCNTCAGTWAKVEPLESPEVAIEQVTYQSHRELHDRYRIDAVPTVVLADEVGVVRASFLGEPSAAELWSAIADLRNDAPG